MRHWAVSREISPSPRQAPRSASCKLSGGHPPQKPPLIRADHPAVPAKSLRPLSRAPARSRKQRMRDENLAASPRRFPEAKANGVTGLSASPTGHSAAEIGLQEKLARQSGCLQAGGPESALSVRPSIRCSMIRSICAHARSGRFAGTRHSRPRPRQPARWPRWGRHSDLGKAATESVARRKSPKAGLLNL